MASTTRAPLSDVVDSNLQSVSSKKTSTKTKTKTKNKTELSHTNQSHSKSNRKAGGSYAVRT